MQQKKTQKSSKKGEKDRSDSQSYFIVRHALKLSMHKQKKGNSHTNFKMLLYNVLNIKKMEKVGMAATVIKWSTWRDL